jgi:adrenodoxin-NADP+ reductase
MHFLRSPIEILDSEGSVSGVRLEHTALKQGENSGSSSSTSCPQQAVGTGIISDLPAQLVLESIGYKSCAIEGAPFNSKLGIIPNQLGQVVQEHQHSTGSGGGGGGDGKNEDSNSVVPGLFVCGWLKRGPSGIIGTNLVDAEQTVDTMVRSQENFPRAEGGGRQGLKRLLEERNIEAVNFKGWEAIDAEEVRRGKAAGKPREKIVTVEEMLEIAKKANS